MPKKYEFSLYPHFTISIHISILSIYASDFTFTSYMDHIKKKSQTKLLCSTEVKALSYLGASISKHKMSKLENI